MAVKELKLDEFLDRLLEKYPSDSDLIKRAYEYIKEKHEGQLRKSGEPYVVHPLSVANLLADMDMDVTTVVAGLLHDVIEDTEATYEEIKNLFGKDVADIVEGVTKIGKIKFRNLKEAQAENFRKLILATANDIRVVIVKLADRLHNMRTLHHLKREKRIRIAEETLGVYAPIAHRLGMWDIKRELEDLSFRYLYPREFNRVKKFVIPKVQKKLEEAGVSAKITYRPKHLYSVWQKTIRKNISLEEVHDLLGVRIVVDTVQECYLVLGFIHSLFKPVPGKFKDYISLPKPNLYQSLHTTVVADKGRMVEFQIRTWEMHQRAEKGIAAHWAYKEGKSGGEEVFNWLRDLVDNLKGSKHPSDVLENLKRDLFSEEVFVFTPKGDLVVLPYGATPIDFAYHIHTEVGDHCTGAKVNGRIVPLTYRLQSGDQVEIITSSHKTPNPAWLKVVVTTKAKNAIKHFIKQREKEEFLRQGKKLFDKLKETTGLSEEELLKKLRSKVRFKDQEELIVALGSGKIPISRILSLLSPKKKSSQEKESKGAGEVSVDGLPGVMYEIASCCNPIPGDEIYGVITRGKGMVLHEKNCTNLKYLLENFPEKVFKAKLKPEGRYKTRIRVKATDRIGMLSEITQRIAEQGSNIWESSSRTLGDGNAYMDFTIDVANKGQLKEVMRSIRSVEGVRACSRLYS